MSFSLHNQGDTEPDSGRQNVIVQSHRTKCRGRLRRLRCVVPADPDADDGRQRILPIRWHLPAPVFGPEENRFGAHPGSVAVGEAEIGSAEMTTANEVLAILGIIAQPGITRSAFPRL